jgi:hypothetical protein
MTSTFRSILLVAAVSLTWFHAGSSRADEVKAGDKTIFGSLTNPGTALIGIFYDTKQSQKLVPMGGDYMQTFADFLASGWDEHFLSRFYRGTRPVYATQVFIPNFGASEAPKAFGLEKYVRGTRWFVIYKGQVSPPEDGTYRFVGVADDVMAVAVNGKTSLISCYAGDGPVNMKAWEEPEPENPRIKTVEGKLRHGDWFTCKKDDIIDLDVLMGEFPGNLCGAWLYIEKKGATYKWINDPTFGKQPVLPVFQVAAQKISPEGMPIPFTTDSPPWTCHQ